ncbi:lipoprotein NlpI [Pirellulimonas nuda]|uniref:Lipoprotein NlpI n=1 Tax=Pirellulimonas nuda TaxID=2528009 RepID=A0A518DJA6_9BACT|nr:tetratricopeptide repeat protein [Pirellulimonas nuda]QDU91522.1 lipoprotein NlpI [Pirellulimonas nuda]
MSLSNAPLRSESAGRWALVWALCLTLGAASAPVRAQDAELSPEQQAFQEVMQKGQAELDAKEFDAAVETFSQALQASGGFNPGPFVGRAKAYLGLKEFDAALEDLREAFQYGQTVPGLIPLAQNVRGEVYMEMGAYDLAMTDLEAAVAADRSNPDIQFNLGKVYTKLGGATQGEKALTKFIGVAKEEDERLAEAYQLRAEAYAGMGKFEEATADISRSLELDDTGHQSHFTQAVVLLQQKKYAEAAESLKKAIAAYKPKEGQDENIPFIEAYLARASALEESGKETSDPAASKAFYAEEEAAVEALLGLLPDRQDMAPAKAASLFRLGVAQRLQGKLADAVKSFSEALELNPAMGEAYFRRGVCFFYMQEYQLAAGDFEQAAAINFDNPRSNLWLGRTWAKLGDYRRAVRAYGAAVAVSDRYVDAYVGRGLANMRLGEYDNAVEDFNQAIRIRPTQARHYYYRALAYEALGEVDKAARSLMTAIEFDEKLIEAYAPLADILESAGRPTLAREYRQKAARLGADK